MNKLCIEGIGSGPNQGRRDMVVLEIENLGFNDMLNGMMVWFTKFTSDIDELFDEIFVEFLLVPDLQIWLKFGLKFPELTKIIPAYSLK